MERPCGRSRASSTATGSAPLKLAALLAKGGPPDLWSGARKTVYLGGAHGTTVSHLSDLLDPRPHLCDREEPHAVAPLLALSQRRTNLLPILSPMPSSRNATAPTSGRLDLLYQDVAQRNQAAIFVENARAVLAAGGRGIPSCCKVRSVTRRRASAAVVRETRAELARGGIEVGPRWASLPSPAITSPSSPAPRRPRDRGPAPSTVRRAGRSKYPDPVRGRGGLVAGFRWGRRAVRPAPSRSGRSPSRSCWFPRASGPPRPEQRPTTSLSGRPASSPPRPT